MREFEITRARKSDAEALAALEAVCFPPEEAATLAGFEARLDAFGRLVFRRKNAGRGDHRHDRRHGDGRSEHRRRDV